MIARIWKLYLTIEDLWFRYLPQKLRYLLVGGFNTVFAYLFFWGLLQFIPYNPALILQYSVTVNVSIFTMRHYVFRSTGNWKQEFLKAWIVYIGVYGFNAVALNFLVRYCGLTPPVAQGVYLFFSTILTFLLHKYFSFKQEKPV